MASALTLHMTDFNGALLNQYQESDDQGVTIGDRRLCKVSARMTFHRDFVFSNWPVFPKQPKFNASGAFVEPDAFVDRNERGYPDGVCIIYIL